jgi:hypothetical protein
MKIILRGGDPQGSSLGLPVWAIEEDPSYIRSEKTEDI